MSVWKMVSACMVPALTAASSLAADLSMLERRWLQGMAPVIAFARETKFPLDIVVQPQPTPGLTPLGMAFIDGRCILVLSMRGNPMAQALLDRIEPELLDATLELMAAHELAHCKRHLEGKFNSVPAGFSAANAPPDPGVKEQKAHRTVRAERREEGYGDLVALGWIRHRHPALYARLHAWLSAERSAPALRGSNHDTTAWLQLVSDSAVLADPQIFKNAAAVWARGLPADE